MLINYLKISLRNLLKIKVYSLINLIGLAVGIAGCLLILLYVHYELSFDRFFENSNQVYRINQQTTEEGADPTYFGLTMSPLAPTIVSEFPEVESATRVRIYDIKSLVRHEDKSYYEAGIAFVDSTFLNVFPLPLIEGDPNTALTRPNTIVLTQEMAEALFGDRSPLGQTVTWIQDRQLEVAGVIEHLPDNFHLQIKALASFDIAEELWPWMSQWSTSCLATYLRLAEGASPGTLESQINDILEQHLSEEELTGRHLYLQPLKDIHLSSSQVIYQYNNNPGNATIVYALIPIAIFILLLACINYINLNTARSFSRSKEVGVRKVVGAGRGDLIIQFLTNSLVMTLLSLILAFVIVELVLPYFRTLTGRDVSFHIFTYLKTWAAVLGGVLVVGLLSGLYPAILLSRFQPVNVLKSFAGMGSRRFQLRHMLIVVQFTISIALITSTLIVIKQLRYTATKNLGFDRHQVMVIPLNNRSIRSQTKVLKEKLLAHPAILSASAISNIPGEEFPQMSIEIEGMSGEEGTAVAVLSVDYDYTDVLKTEMVQGRSFSRDIATDEKTAFIVNQTAVEKLGWDDPIGKELSLPWYERKGQVIGVIHDFHNRTLHYAIEPLVIVMEPMHYSKLLVRIDGRDIPGALAAINAAWEELSPLYPFEYSFLDSDLNNMYRSESNTARLLILFSALAVFIACLGLFGLATFIAEQRTKEVGIRKTLGASIPSIVVLLTRDLTLWVIISNIIACPIAYYTMSRWLNGFVFRTNIDWSIFVLAAILTLIITIATISIQAFKTALSNPVNTLRYE